MKQLYEIIGYIPTEAMGHLPPGVELQKYWEANDSFINAYDDGRDIVLTYRCVYCKKKLKVKITDFKWYCFISKSDMKKLPRGSLKKYTEKIQICGQYLKLYVDNESINEIWENEKDPEDRNEDDRIRLKNFLNKHGVSLLEGDLKNYKRFCIDHEIKVSNDFRYIFFDIETDDRKDGIVVGRDRILSFAAVDQDGKKKFFLLKEDTDKAEEELLNDIWEYIYKYDIIIGWNSGNFDVPYLRERWKRYRGYFPTMKDVAHIDFMKRFQKLFYYDQNIRSWSLNFISNYFIGDVKIEVNEGIYNLWQDNPTKLKKYNIKDCVLLLQLEQKLKVFELILLECQWCGTFPSKFYLSELLDNYILRYSNKNDVHFKSTSFGDKKEEEEHVVGGYVLDPVAGIHDNVYVFDFKSLYPTIIMTWNISLETFMKKKPKTTEINTVNEFWTKKNKKGMLPTIIRKLLDERKKYKEIQLSCPHGSKDYDAAFATQVIVKEMANSLYGTMAQRGNRYYDRDVAESITKAGHYLIKLTKQLMKEYFGYETLYGDSVPYDTYIPMKYSNNVVVEKIGDIFAAFPNRIVRDRGKEIIYLNDNNIRTMSGKGKWQKVRRIIRHKTRKKLYNITCPDSDFSVTTDHSFYSNGSLSTVNNYEDKMIYSSDIKIDTVDKRKLKFTNTVKRIDIKSLFDGYIKDTITRMDYSCEKNRDKTLTVGIKAKTKGFSDKLFKAKRFIKLDKDFGIVLGGYMAEGSVSKHNRLKFTSPILYCSKNKKEVKYFFSLARKVFGSDAVEYFEYHNGARIKLKTFLYARLLEELCGYGSSKKQFPDFSCMSNRDFVEGIFLGYQYGDGIKDLFDKDLNTGSIGGKSRKMVSQAFFLLNFYFDKDYYYRFRHKKEKNVVWVEFRNKDTANTKSLAAIKRWKEKRVLYKSEHTRKTDGYVYDLEVEEDHTFIDACGGTILHNTDSVFVKMDDNPDVSKVLEKIHEGYAEHLKKDFNIDISHIVLEHEKTYSKILLLHKKQYAGRLIEIDGEKVDKVYGKGLDYIKRDAIEYGRRLQIELIRQILYEDYNLKHYIDFIRKEMNIFETGKFDLKDITIMTRISRRPENYKQKAVHIRVAEDMIKSKKEFYVGMHIPYIVTEKNPRLQGIHVDDFDGTYSKEYYWDMKIYGLLLRLLACVFPKYDWDQYLFETIAKRKKKMTMYRKWLNDPKKKREYVEERINNDRFLSKKNRDVLLGKRSPFKVKQSPDALKVKKRICITTKKKGKKKCLVKKGSC